MCGIAGKFAFGNDPVNSQELKTMIDSIAHRGPDGEGVWIDDARRGGFGHRRLAILDLSECGHQPMRDENNLTITFNGEIYNFIEIRDELKKKGHKFRTNTDTEVILAAYSEYGEDCLKHFDGMFAFAIWDENKKRLFAARDRFGEKPFYYYKDRNQFVFASEMKAIFSLGIPKTIADEMIFYFLAYDVAENPNDKAATFYKEINQLPPAHCLTIDGSGDVKIRQYWDINAKNKCDASLDDAVKKFRELFAPPRRG